MIAITENLKRQTRKSVICDRILDQMRVAANKRLLSCKKENMAALIDMYTELYNAVCYIKEKDEC